VVAIPAARIDEVLEIAERIENVENRIVDLAIAGATLTEARRQLGYHTLQTPCER